MRVAHLIMVHRNIKQVERLVSKLQHKDYDFYIHVDKKIRNEEFEFLSNLNNVHLIQKRELINWAGYSFTKNILRCVREILKSGNYDYINLMSGQDYPIKSSQVIHDFFTKNLGKSFVSYDDNLNSDWWKQAKGRFEKYHFTEFKFKGRHRLEFLINLILPKRKFPMPYKPYGGESASWWILSRECADYLVDLVENNLVLQRFAYFTWCPDEFLITTILMNSIHKNKIINNSQRYIDWSQGRANPKTFTKSDFKELVISEMLFARKFDMGIDSDVMDLLDKANGNN